MDYPINMKIGDENFTRLLAGYQSTPQGKKNTITALRKLVKRSGKDIFYITRNDAETFYDSCISDISALKKDQIIRDDEKMYIRFVSVTELGEYPRYLLVPDDLHTMILQLCDSTDASYEYLLISRRHTPCAVRTLEHALNKIIRENSLGSNLTFSSLRNMGIRILLSNGALPQEVADYLGIQGKWLSRYEKVPLHLVKDMNKYSNIEIK